jgi:hypothetical protein
MMVQCQVYMISRVSINKVTLIPETGRQAPVTPSDLHKEGNQKIPGQPGSWEPPWNLRVSLQVSLRGSHRSLKAGFRKSSYFVYNLPGCNFISLWRQRPTGTTRYQIFQSLHYQWPE